MYRFDEVNRFFEGTQLKSQKSCIKKSKLISAICVGTTYCIVHGKINSHIEYHRDMQACSIMQSKYVYTIYVLHKLDRVE